MGEETPIPIEEKAGWAPELAGLFGKGEKYLSLPGIEPQIL
jgi:hypothetical protein